ncbi:MAG: hypothetical protein Kow00108_17110 [Calditrichia bacterium]
MKVEHLNNPMPAGYMNQTNQSAGLNKTPVQGKTSESSDSRYQQDKIRLPENYETRRTNLRQTINPEEQAFFEAMYPSHRHKIKAYLNQQDVQAPVKGKFVDIRR